MWLSVDRNSGWGNITATLAWWAQCLPPDCDGYRLPANSRCGSLSSLIWHGSWELAFKTMCVCAWVFIEVGACESDVEVSTLLMNLWDLVHAGYRLAAIDPAESCKVSHQLTLVFRVTCTTSNLGYGFGVISIAWCNDDDYDNGDDRWWWLQY